MSDPIFFAPLRVPITDERTGLMSREWYLFFQAMFLRIGGAQAFSAEDLQLVGDVNDATDDGSEARAATADLERALALADEPPSTSAADIAELQMLVASIPEDASGTRAAPTAKVGLTAVPGSAFTLMSSDAAPPLDQAIAPAMSGKWAFTNNVDGGPNAAVLLRGTASNSSAVGWGQLDQPVGGKYWDAIQAGTLLLFRVTDDTNAARATWLQVTRNLTTIAAVAFGNATDNPAYNFQGTGVATFNGDLKTVGKSGFNNTAPIVKPAVTGSRGANAALASLLTSLANYGLITDSTTP